MKERRKNFGSCDNCGKNRYLTSLIVYGVEGGFCWACRGLDPQCQECGEDLIPDLDGPHAVCIDCRNRAFEQWPHGETHDHP